MGSVPQAAAVFGALAVAPTDPTRSAVSSNQPSSAAAQNAALGYCGGDCAIQANFPSGMCAAYAASMESNGGSYWGWGTDANQAIAQNKALQSCRNNGGGNCVLSAEGCNR
ncbi:MAG: DUF4189 domain-containing protein [Deltaproteobacteria bacterium]|nr:DUF4189 domain-containing protein [Deltaproteobacteria bacterium]